MPIRVAVRPADAGVPPGEHRQRPLAHPIGQSRERGLQTAVEADGVPGPGACGGQRVLDGSGDPIEVHRVGRHVGEEPVARVAKPPVAIARARSREPLLCGVDLPAGGVEDRRSGHIEDGTDTFVFTEDGQIRVQTVMYTPQPAD